MNSVSIVIRTLNEKDALVRLFKSLKSQNFDGEIELIVVDNESIDGTLEVAEEEGAKVVTIKRNEFSYPKSMNLGMAAAKYPIVILMVGHALPTGENWLKSGLMHFNNPEVAGVYSPVLPHKTFGISEFFLYYPRYILDRIRSPFPVGKAGRGVFAATNIALRKGLWEKHHFEEKYGLGGEDTHWADWAIKNKHHIICDTDFAVRHSHHHGFLGVISQVIYWDKLKKPTKFSRRALKFRKDIDFR